MPFLLPRVLPCVPVFLSLAGRPGSNGWARRRKSATAVSCAALRFYQNGETRGPLIKPCIDLVVVLFHELDVAGKLNGLRRLVRLVELFQYWLLVLRWNCLVGGDAGDLFLDRGRGVGECLGFGVDAGHPHG